jgi:ABC-2 type transport system ATP-binding protein
MLFVMNMIEVKNLVKKFGDFTAVNDISFNVAKGEIFAFLGPNGAGKSTTIKMLTTLLHPTTGSIMVNGHDPVKESDLVRHSFGIVFQDPSLDDELTAWENMEFHGVLYKVPKELRRERIDQLLKFVDLSDRRDNLVKEFSGGMKRRLEIARGLLHHPKIIFLDEPTLGLDPQTRNHMWEYLKELNKTEGTTVFFTTHYMEEADRVAQRIAVIDHGTIIASGTSADLKAKTNTSTLEDAFLALTGKTIRNEEAGGADQMRMMRQVWRGGKNNHHIYAINYLHSLAPTAQKIFAIKISHDRISCPASPFPFCTRIRPRAGI